MCWCHQHSVTDAGAYCKMDGRCSNPGQSHLNLEEVIEYELKTGDDGMEKRELRDLETIFAQVEDPRMERTKLHRLRDIIILAICGVICGARDG